MTLGVSVFPAELDVARGTLAAASEAGAGTVFTSLHIPEDDPAMVRKRAAAIAGLAHDRGMNLIADVEPRVTAAFGDDPWTVLRDLGVTRVRLDDGYTLEESARIARVLPVAFNASTVVPAQAAQAAVPGSRPASGTGGSAEPRPSDPDDPSAALALHNYYPRTWTGLSEKAVRDSARDWHEAGQLVGAFLSGDARRRGPLRAGLPTIEDLRDADPLVQLLVLEDCGCDQVLVGDPALAAGTWRRIGRWIRQRVLEVPVVLDTGQPIGPALATALAAPDDTRPDDAQYLVRLRGSRARLRDMDLTGLRGGEPRPRGSLTVELDAAGRYRGEIALTRADLPGDPWVAVLGRVPAASRRLVDLAGGDQRLALSPRSASPTGATECPSHEQTDRRTP